MIYLPKIHKEIEIEKIQNELDKIENNIRDNIRSKMNKEDEINQIENQISIGISNYIEVEQELNRLKEM